MGGVYVIPAIFMDVRGVFTNTVPIDAYRGAGKPEANYLIERLIDVAARRCGFDPIELRRRNLMREFPLSQGARHASSIAAASPPISTMRSSRGPRRVRRATRAIANSGNGCAGSA